MILCKIYCSTSITSNFRIVAIGDIHGNYDTLLMDLFQSNITTAPSSCEWKSQRHSSTNLSTILVQMGDVVDRKANAWSAWKCLKHLQNTAAQFNSRVVRLIGSK